MIRLAGHPPESRTFATRAEARAWAEDREDQLRSGVVDGGAGRSFGDVMALYMERVAPHHRGARWEVVRLRRLLRDPIAEVPLSALDAAVMADWRDRRMAAVAAGSVLREMTLLRSVCEYARRDLGWLQDNPLQDVRRPRSPRPRDRRISDDEIERLRLALGWPDDAAPIETMMQQVAVMMLLAIETGMRAGEMLSLTWRDISIRHRTATLAETKNGTGRDVPLSRRAIALLEVMRGTDPERVFTVSPASRDALWRKARDAAGIEDLRFHDTRHEAITRLAQRLDVLDLARMVGHRDLQSLRTYYNATASEIAARLD